MRYGVSKITRNETKKDSGFKLGQRLIIIKKDSNVFKIVSRLLQ